MKETHIRCDKCHTYFQTKDDLNKHLSEVHISKLKVKNTLMLGDSMSKYQNPQLIEKAMGGRGLSTPGCSSPRTGRAYCSTRDWPNSHYPSNNLKDKVMEELKKKEHSYLLFGAPCNDITNIGVIENKSERYRLAIKSSENCIAIAEEALRKFQKLEKVIIPERLPRADSLCDLSEYSNFALKSLANQSELRERVVVVIMESMYFSDEDKMVKIFGSPKSHYFDGIHPKGKLGRKLYNSCLIAAVRESGLTITRQRVEEEVEQVPTSNMFHVLGN